MPKTIMWFRRDLRLSDNPALADAVGRGDAVIPVFILDEVDSRWGMGSASRWWLHQSLAALATSLEARASRLVLRRGSAREVLSKLIEQTGAEAVVWNRLYEPASVERDTTIKQSLRAEGIEARSHNGALLWEPWDVKTKQNEPYKVFTPFWKACQAREAIPPYREIRKVPAPTTWPDSLALKDLRLLPESDWALGIGAEWTPGEKGAAVRLREFLRESLEHYSEGRDRPDQRHTSRLSPHLHFGEIGPRQVFQAARESGKFLSELAWREFAHHLLFHFPRTTDESLRPPFLDFPWRDDPQGLKAWQQGQTGYPIVDAGMRQLWKIGWMHNRVRMIVASFLTKDLLIPWQRGAEWFWDTLVDADLANNTMGWQWTAGCGADAAPYFRVFNPVSQGERFDPNGEYVRQWVPELRAIPAKWIHKPWEAPVDVLGFAKVRIGTDYPSPIVDHQAARIRALDAYARIQRG